MSIWVGTAGGGQTYIVVTTYADLPPASSVPDEIYVVTTASGIWPFNKRDAGLYWSNGSVWTYFGDGVGIPAGGTTGQALSKLSNADYIIGWVTPGGGGGGATVVEVEINIGSNPVRCGRFVITSTGLTVGKPVIINQASGPYTGKGTLADEAECDSLTVQGKIISATEIECFWGSISIVRDNFKFNYFISA